MAIPHVLICQQSIWTGKITKVPWKFSAKFPAKFKSFQKFKEDFGNDSNIGYILEVDLSYPKHQAGISRSIDFRHLQYNHVQLLI